MRGAIGLAALLLTFAPHARVRAESDGIEAKTLRRVHDPVVLRTSALAGLPDHGTAHYRLYAASGRGKLGPIPFQFDQRGPDGDLVLSSDGAESDFTCDDDDELVFMAKDTGNRVPPAELPQDADAALEVEVTDPPRGQRGWAYLVHVPGDPPARSPLRYATFDPARDEARALFYQVSYAHARSNFLESVRIQPAAGGTGEPLIHRILMRISPTFSFLAARWKMTFTEESFAVVPDGLKNGPVRAIRRVRQSLDLGRWFPEMPTGTVYTYYYFSSFTTPSTFSVPWLALKTLRDSHFESIDDLGTQSADLRYWDGTNPGGVSFTPGNRPAGPDADHDWWIVSGSRGTCLHTLTIPRPWRTWGIRRGIVFQDDGQPEVGPPGAGYSLLRMTNLREPGAYEIDSALVILPQAYRPGDEAEALAMFRTPLETRTRPLTIDGTRYVTGAVTAR